MLHLYLKLYGLNHLAGLIATHGVTMKAKHFELATADIRINQRNKSAVRRVLVDGQPISDVARELDINQSQLSKQVRRILESLNSALAARGLTIEEWIIDKDMKPMLDALEEKSLAAAESAKPKSKRRRKKINNHGEHGVKPS